MKRFNQKGFTLIELLVVVAIIGILASIVLVSLNSARAKARDASAKGSMSSIRAQAEIFYDTHGGSYAGMCADSDVAPLIDAVQSETGQNVDCQDAALSYAASIVLNNENNFCIDSSGFAGDYRGTTQIAGVGTVGGDFQCVP